MSNLTSNEIVIEHLRQVVADYDARLRAGIDTGFGSTFKAGRVVVEAMRQVLRARPPEEATGKRIEVTDDEAWRAPRRTPVEPLRPHPFSKVRASFCGKVDESYRLNLWFESDDDLQTAWNYLVDVDSAHQRMREPSEPGALPPQAESYVVGEARRAWPSDQLLVLYEDYHALREFIKAGTAPAEPSGDARDAARYRWLRDHQTWSADDPMTHKALEIAIEVRGSDWDRAIDHAMKPQTKDGAP